MESSNNSCNIPMVKVDIVDLESQRIPVPPAPGAPLDDEKKAKQAEISSDKIWSKLYEEKKADQAEAAADDSWNRQQKTEIGVDFDSLANHSRLAYGGIIVSGIVLLVALTSTNTYHDHKHYHYGISVAAVPLLVSAIAWGLAELTWNHTEFFVKNTLVVNYFLFFWCFIGACVLTFGGPFDVAGNGTLLLCMALRCFLLF